MKVQTENNMTADDSTSLNYLHLNFNKFVNTLSYGVNLIVVVGKAMFREFVRSYNTGNASSESSLDTDSSSRRIVRTIGTHRKIRKRGVEYMSVMAEEAIAHQPALDHVAIWRDLSPGSFPSLEQLRKRIVCLEYSKEKEDKIVDWITKCNADPANRRVRFKMMIVFANYNLLEGENVARLIRRFSKAGASFSDFPEKADTFIEAVLRYNDELDEIKIINEQREAAVNLIQARTEERESLRI